MKVYSEIRASKLYAVPHNLLICSLFTRVLTTYLLLL